MYADFDDNFLPYSEFYSEAEKTAMDSELTAWAELNNIPAPPF